jgi:hypothetical protein
MGALLTEKAANRALAIKKSVSVITPRFIDP